MTIDQIIEKLPSSGVLGEYLGTTDQAVRAWSLKDRRRIPPKHWQRIVQLAKERNLKGITYEALAKANELEAAT